MQIPHYFVTITGFGHYVVLGSDLSLDARVRLKIPVTNSIPNAKQRHI